MSEFWWGMIWLSLFIPLMFLWGYTLWDVFGRHDIHGFAKVLWAFAIVLFPLIGMFVYFIARPKELDQYSNFSYGASYGYPYGSTAPYRPDYERASGPSNWGSIETINRMHEEGTLSDAEYKDLAERVNAQQREAA